MQIGHFPWDINTQKNITQEHKRYIKQIEKELTDYLDDNSLKDRKKEQLCKYCTYIDNHKIAMSAFFDTWCAKCNTPMQFVNSDVNMLCKYCAVENNSCCKCGAEMD